MKKNISINLQGIIFHIEEDGYEQLSAYLASIRSYFSTYEGHEEIIADIEARIAEIFAGHLSPGKQVITQEDVQKLITQMGNVSDFEQEAPVLEEAAYATTAAGAAYGAGAGAYENGYTTADAGANPGAGTAPGYEAADAGAPYAPKKLYRDYANRLVSGVAAGLARYLGIDSLWVRALLVILLVLAPFTAGISVAVVLAGYIILWIAMPVNYSLPETNVKKLFRDPVDKQLGGVASGIAKYFGLDVTVVRVLFLASVLLGGTGLLLYIGFWIAVPEAVTLTERMQMQGNPVTLSGIENTLKENLRFKDQNGEETAAAKILLLPLRLLGQVLTWLGRVLGPLFSALISLIRIIAGVVLLVMSVALMLGLFVALLVASGVVNEQSGFWTNDLPVQVFLDGFPQWGIFSGFVVGFIPALLLFILAISLLAKRFFLRAIAGWSMFAVWLVGVFALVAAIALTAQHFRYSAETETTQAFPVAAYPTLTLDAYATQRGYGRARFEIQGYQGSDLQVKQLVTAKGFSEEDAEKNTQMVAYRVLQRDSVLRFDDSYAFKEGAVFREQQVHLTLRIPENKPLRFTKEFIRLLPSAAFEGEFSRDKIVRNTWQVQGEHFTCLTCATDTLDAPAARKGAATEATVAASIAESLLLSAHDYGSNEQNYNFSDFSSVSASGPYHLRLVQGHAFTVSARGNPEVIKKLRITKSGSELRIQPEQRFLHFSNNQEPVLIQITLPELKTLKLAGAIEAEVAGIRTDRFELVLAGAIKSHILNVEAKTMKVEMAGISNTTLTGHVNKLDLEMSGAGSLNATNLQAGSVTTDLAGACNATVFATNKLRADATGASTLRYKGNPADVSTDATGASKVTKL